MGKTRLPLSCGWLMVFTLFFLITHSHSKSVSAREQSEHDSGSLYSVKAFLGGVVKRFFNSQPEPNLLKRVKRSEILTVRIDGCKSNSDCVDRNKYGTNISSALVYCDTNSGLCMCNECFVRLNNSCEVVPSSCRSYSTASNQCVDHRKSQKTAFLLSVFLSSVGAANFYIGDYLLAGLQLGLFVLLILAAVLTFCVPMCLVCCEDEDDEYSDSVEKCVICILALGIIAIVVLLMVLACWWVADLALFAYNARGELNGCPLINDLL